MPRMRWLRPTLGAAILATSAVSAAAQKSNTTGVMLNAQMHSASVTVQGSDTSESGLGFGIRLGWGITKNVTLFVGLDTASIETDAMSINNGVYGLTQADLGGIYTFRAGKSLLPYLEAGIGMRRITSDLTISDASGNITEGKASTTGMAFSYGLGLNYYFSRPVALNIGVTISGGHFGDYKVNDTRVHNTDFNAASALARFGLTWYPMKD